MNNKFFFLKSGGTPPAPPTTAPTTAAPTPINTTAAPPNDGCGSPGWDNDMWCDDENNNADCNYDGGACCFNEAQGWDDYCTVRNFFAFDFDIDYIYF